MPLLKVHCCPSPRACSGQGNYHDQVPSRPRLPCRCRESNLSWKQSRHNLPRTPDNLSFSDFSAMALPPFPSQRQPFRFYNEGSAPTMFSLCLLLSDEGAWLSPVLPHDLLPWYFLCIGCLVWMLLESNWIVFELLLQISSTLKSTGNWWGAPGDCWYLF